MNRDAAEFSEASHWPDMAQGCDTLAAHVEELVHEEWPAKADVRAKAAVNHLVGKVVKRLLDEGRLAPLVDVKRLPGKELLAKLLAEILEAPDAVLMVYCIDYVMETGVALGISETAIAERCDVTKSTVSHHCRLLTETYRGGKPATGMKSEEAVESYRRNRTGKSSRGPRIEWQFAETFAKHYGRESINAHSGPN
jgi:DNA-binding transcriptional ArsR family regulator